MRITLRLLALAIAVAGIVDPAIPFRATLPLSVVVAMPAPSHPDADRARALRDRLIADAGDGVAFGSGAAPDAAVAIGAAEIPADADVPVYVMPVGPADRSITITAMALPDRTVVGQTVDVASAVHGRGLAGERTVFALELQGAVVAKAEHQWTGADARHELRLSFVPPSAGLHRVRLVALTDASGDRAVADAAVLVRDRRLRVLVYEPRPSWPTALVRRALEADPMFEVSATSRTSQVTATTSGDAPAVLPRLRVDGFEAVVVGALDELSEADVRELDRFVRTRGGTILLLPDRRVPALVRRTFGLPEAAETLVESPMTITAGAGRMRASELLLFRRRAAPFTRLGSVDQAGEERAVVVGVHHGSGEVVLSGALDAWRYRGEREGFDRFWRALVADAALRAPDGVTASLDRSLVRRSEAVRLEVVVRQTAFERDDERLVVPPVAAHLTGADGATTPIRLWPGARPGAFDGRVSPAADGRYTVTVEADGARTELPLLVAGDVVGPATPGDAAAAHAASASGGAVVQEPLALLAALERLPRSQEPVVLRPMRSIWWMAAFTLLLGFEWMLRRRAGLP